VITVFPAGHLQGTSATQPLTLLLSQALSGSISGGGKLPGWDNHNCSAATAAPDSGILIIIIKLPN
jgi:hypothetical protein